MLSHFKKLALLFFALAPCLFADNSAPLMEFQEAINSDNYKEEVARFAIKHLGPSVSVYERARIIHQISSKNRDHVRELLRASESNIQDPLIRRTVASSVLDQITTAPVLNWLFLDLEKLTKETPELLYEKGLSILQSEKNRTLAKNLVVMGEQFAEPARFSAQDLPFLVSKGATDPKFQDLLLKKSPHSAARILMGHLGSQGDFTGSYFDLDQNLDGSQVPIKDWDYMRKLISDGKLSLSEENIKQLKENLLKPDVSPEAKAIAFDILKQREPIAAKALFNQLVSSTDPRNHLMAERLSREGELGKQREPVQMSLREDIFRTEDPTLLSLLARNPLSETANWKDMKVGDSERKALKRLIEHPDEKVASLALKILSESGKSYGLVPDLLQEQLLKRPKAVSSDLVFHNGINEDLSNQLLQTLKRFPNEVKENKATLIDAITSNENTLPQKKWVLSLLESSGEKEAALPTFLSELSKRRNYRSQDEIAWMSEEASQMVRKNPELFKQFEDALEGKLKRLVSEPSLVGRLKGKDPFEDKFSVAQVLSQMGSKTAMDFLMEELKKPLDIEVPEAGRLRYQKAAKAFSEAIKSDPGLMTPERKKELQDFLSLKDPAFTAAQNDLNKFLPENLVRELDQEISRERLHPSNIDPCSVMCRVAKSLSENIGDNFEVKADKFLESENARSSFGFAVRSLMGEFLLKADQAGCEIEGIEAKVSQLMTEAKDAAKGEQKKASSEEVGEVQKTLKGPGGSSEAIERALAFLNKTKTSQNTNEQGLPTNSATLYFYLQTQRAAEALKLSGGDTNPKSMEELQKKLADHLTKIMDARTDLIHGEGGSLVTVYALAAIGASMPQGSDIQKRVARIFSEMRSEPKEHGQSAFPYNFGPEVPRESERGGAARSVVAQLAIYKGGNSQEKLSNADQLLASLGTYDKHFRDIFSGIGLNRTHDRDDIDHLAPYYGPSTIPYAFEAISLLGKEKELSAEQKEKLESIKGSLKNKLLGMFEPNGLFQRQNSNYYTSAHLYDNALTGLALEQACRDQKQSSSANPSGERRRSDTTKLSH